MKSKHRPGTFILVHSKYRLLEIDAIGQSVFMWLCNYADATGLCWPSISTLARICRVSKNTIKSRIKRLEQSGLLQKTQRKRPDSKENDTNLYQIIEDNWIPRSQNKSTYALRESTDDWHVNQQLASNSNQKELNPNNSIYRDVSQKTKSLSYLKNIPKKDLAELIEKYSVSETFIQNRAEDVIDYCQAKGKRYSDYKAALRNFIKIYLEKHPEARIIRREPEKSEQREPVRARTPEEQKALEQKIVETREKIFGLKGKLRMPE